MGSVPLLTSVPSPEPESSLVTIVVAVAAAILVVIAVVAGVAVWRYRSGKAGPARAREAGHSVTPPRPRWVPTPLCLLREEAEGLRRGAQ